MNDASDVVATADGQQQSPGEEGIGVKLNSLRAQGGPAAILPNVRAGEKALETVHGCINVLGGKRHAHQAYKHAVKYRTDLAVLMVLKLCITLLL